MNQVIADEILNKVKTLDDQYKFSVIFNHEFGNLKLNLIKEYEDYPEEMQYAINNYDTCYLFGIGPDLCPNPNITCKSCKQTILFNRLLNCINCPHKR